MPSPSSSQREEYTEQRARGVPLKKRKKRPSRAIILVSIGVCVLLCVCGACVVFWAPIFRVKDYAVTGEVHTSTESVIAASGITVGDNLLRVDTEASARAVAVLPWVREATVVKQYPSGVGIHLVERTPVLFVHRDDGTHLIDDTGEPFIISDATDGALEVTGTTSDDSALFRAIVDVLASISARDDGIRQRILTVNAPSAYEISLIFDDGHTIYWGSREDSANKVLALRAVLQRPELQWNISAPNLVTTP